MAKEKGNKKNIIRKIKLAYEKFKDAQSKSNTNRSKQDS